MPEDSIQQRLANLSPEQRRILSDRLSKLTNTSKQAITPRSIDSPCLASSAQQRFWFVQQLFPYSSLYNNSRVLKFNQPTNIKAIHQALQAIIDRHEVLRTTYKMEDDGKLYQVIHRVSIIDLPIVDLSDRPENLKEEIKNQASQPFNLSLNFPIRSILFEVNEEYTLLVIVHHIASDRWSSQIFLAELNYFYEIFLTNQSPTLPALSIQYADFSQWQRNQSSQNNIQNQLDYWKAKLKNHVSTINLSTDYPRPHIASYQGQSIAITIPKPLTKALKNLSQNAGVTLFITLLTAFKILLYRYSNQTDITVGTPISGRNHLETEDLIGCFLNTLPLRTEILGTLSFKELLSQVRATVSEAQAHQDIPFEKLIEELKPERDLSYSPLFQVVFNFQNIPKIDRRASQSWFDITRFKSETIEFDLAVTLREVESELVGTFAYSTDLFKDGTIISIKNHYENLLQSIVDNPDRSISTIPLLTLSEQDKILKEWNDTETEYPRDKYIHHLFEEQVERTPENIAVVFEDREITYRELNNRANQLARHLQTLEIPEALVGICMERSLEMIVGILGILKAGGAYVPLDPSYNSERLEFMVRDTNLSLILTKSDLIDRLPLNLARSACLDGDWAKIIAESVENPISSLNGIAYVMYTSGSTGIPKGVLIQHRGIMRLICNSNYIHLKASDRIGHLANISFDASTFEIWGALLNGGQLIIIPQSIVYAPQAFSKFIIENRISVLFLTTALFNQFAHTIPTAFESLRYLLFGGENADVNSVKALLDRGLPHKLVHVYGPTENTTFSTFHEISQLDRTSYHIPIGKAIANTQIYILDSYLQPVPIGVNGEIYLGGDGIAEGYLNRPELTDEKFIVNPFYRGKLYKTGDIARYLPDGNIEFIGRLDNQVKIRGFRIELGEIEAIVSQYPDIQENVVIVDGGEEKRLVAYFVAKQMIETQQLVSFLEQKLPKYMIPPFFIQLDSLPLSPNGKINRSALPTPTSDILNPNYNQIFLPARDRLEQQLIDLWEKILNIHPIGIHDNFFSLGGNSLSSVRLATEITEIFECELPISAFFQISTIADLAQSLREPENQKIEPSYLCLEDYQSLLAHSAGRAGTHLGRRGLVIEILPEISTSSQPFIWIGTVNHARGLKLNQPIYVLPGNSYTNLKSPKNYISAIASLLVEELLTVQTSEPYVLGGYCYDGRVVLEMANQLQKIGKEVALVVLIDTRGYSKLYQFWRRLDFKLAILKLHSLNLSKLSLTKKWEYIFFRLRNNFTAVAEAETISPDYQELNFLELRNAMLKYPSQRYEGKSLLIMANIFTFGRVNLSHSDASLIFPYFGWENVLTGKVKSYKISCNHGEIVLDPYIQEVGTIIFKEIEESVEFGSISNLQKQQNVPSN